MAMCKNVIINVMKVRTFFAFLLFFFLGLSSVVLALTPTIESVSPDTRYIGWLDNITIVGASFETNASVEVGGNISVLNTTYVSSTSVVAQISITGLATVGATYIKITNDPPTGESYIAPAIFNVVASSESPVFSNIIINSRTYEAPSVSSAMFQAQAFTNTYCSPEGFVISFEASSSSESLPASSAACSISTVFGDVSPTLTQNGANAVIGYAYVPFIPTANAGDVINADLSITDAIGQEKEETLSVGVYTAVADDRGGAGTGTATKPNLKGKVRQKLPPSGRGTWNPKTENVKMQFQPDEGIEFREGFVVILMQWGQIKAKRRYPGTYNQNASIEIPKEWIERVGITNGMVDILIQDIQTGQIIAKNKIMMYAY